MCYIMCDIQDAVGSALGLGEVGEDLTPGLGEDLTSRPRPGRGSDFQAQAQAWERI